MLLHHYEAIGSSYINIVHTLGVLDARVHEFASNAIQYVPYLVVARSLLPSGKARRCLVATLAQRMLYGITGLDFILTMSYPRSAFESVRSAHIESEYNGCRYQFSKVLQTP